MKHNQTTKVKKQVENICLLAGPRVMKEVMNNLETMIGVSGSSF